MTAEEKLQSVCVAWARSMFEDELMIVHVPNGKGRSIIQAVELKQMGVLKGYPDLVLHTHGSGTCFIEMKIGKGKQSDEQKAVADKMKRFGLEYHVVKDFDEFKRVVKEFVRV